MGSSDVYCTMKKKWSACRYQLDRASLVCLFSATLAINKIMLTSIPQTCRDTVANMGVELRFIFVCLTLPAVFTKDMQLFSLSS